MLRDLKKLVVEDRGFGIMYGFLSIFLGLGTVILHNVWVFNWQGFLTVIAWLALLKGIYIIAYPEPSKKTDFEVRIPINTYSTRYHWCFGFMDAYSNLYKIIFF